MWVYYIRKSQKMQGEAYKILKSLGDRGFNLV
mgnify:CR=1 FL=1